MNEPATGLSTEFIVGAVILILAIFYFAWRFVNRAKNVNKEVRREDTKAPDDTA